MRVVGTKEEVWAGEALKTKGGLSKSDLTMNARGKVVSIAKSQQATARYNQMKKDGYTLHPSYRSGSMLETGNLAGGATLSGASMGGSMLETGNLAGGATLSGKRKAGNLTSGATLSGKRKAPTSKLGLFSFS